MNQPKDERKQGASADSLVAPEDVFYADVENRRGDRGFDKTAWQVDQAESGERKSQRMRSRETGDEERGAAARFADDEQPEEEEQVIVARENMANAQEEKLQKAASAGLAPVISLEDIRSVSSRALRSRRDDSAPFTSRIVTACRCPNGRSFKSRERKLRV